jgi:hypothetical protein
LAEKVLKGCGGYLSYVTEAARLTGEVEDEERKEDKER